MIKSQVSQPAGQSNSRKKFQKFAIQNILSFHLFSQAFAKLPLPQWRSKGGGKRGHALWGAGLGGTPAHFLQLFKNAF